MLLLLSNSTVKKREILCARVHVTVMSVSDLYHITLFDSDSEKNYTVENIQVEGVRFICVWVSQSKLLIDATI